MFPRLIFFLLLLVLPATVPAEEEATRLAIVSDPGAADLGVLMSERLPGYILLERDELARIGDEKRLATLALNDPHALGQLAGSDGLLFLSRDKGQYRARLTAVNLGYILFDVAFDPKATIEEVARRLGTHLEALKKKLNLPAGKALPLTVLNLRVDLTSADAAEVEQKATLLLENSLAQLPQVVLLERRRPLDVAFERALKPSAPELLRGVYLIDGTLALSLIDAGLLATLRIRSPEGNLLTTLTAKGNRDDLSAFVGEFVAGVAAALKLPDTHPVSSSQDEAREYLHEGIWAYRRKLYGAAIAALDSAELLGETAPDLLAIRIPSLAQYATTTSQIVNITPPIPVPDDHPYPEKAIEALKRAMADFQLYKESKGMDHLVLFDSRRVFEGRTSHLDAIVTTASLQMLAMLDRTAHPGAESFRAVVRDFVGFDPHQGKIPRDVLIAVRFGGNLARSKEEEIAFYHTISTDLKWAAYPAWHMQRNVTPENFCSRFITDPAERKREYFKFWKALETHKIAMPASLFYQAMWASPEEKEAACERFYRHLFDNRQMLVETQRLSFLHRYAFNIEKERRVKVAHPALIDTLLFLLTVERPLRLQLVGSWVPDLFPEERAAELWAAMQDYQQRLKARGEGTGYFTLYNRTFVQRFGDLSTQAAPKELVVTRFWQPKGLKEMFLFNDHQFIISGNDVIIAGQSQSKPKVYRISSESFESHLIEPPEPVRFQALQEHQGHLFQFCTDARAASGRYYLWRYNLVTRDWASFPAPEGEGQLFSIGGKLYFTNRSANESAIGIINPENGEYRLLASSRRRPARNQFDDTKQYDISTLFEGPEGEAYALIEGRAYRISEEPGEWPPLNHYWTQHASHQGRKTLLQCASVEKYASNALLFIDPERQTQEFWIGPVRLFDPRKESTLPPTVHEPSQASRWLVGDGIALRCGKYQIRGDDLIGFQTEGANGRVVDLLYYRKGHEKPVRIPLQFQMSPADQAALAAVLSPSTNTFEFIVNPRSEGFAIIHSTPKGLVIRPVQHGFWYLPYSDLDAYLAQYGTK